MKYMTSLKAQVLLDSWLRSVFRLLRMSTYLLIERGRKKQWFIKVSCLETYASCVANAPSVLGDFCLVCFRPWFVHKLLSLPAT